MGQSSKLSFLDIEAKEVDHRHSSITHFISANKVFCFSLFLFLCFLISTLVSIAVSLAVTAAPVPSTKAVMHLSNSINEIKSEQAVLIKNYQTFKQEHLKIESHLNGLTSTALKNILMDQEIRFQNFLTTLKAGMQDLSTEFPNGKSWYQDYSEQISLAQKESIKRHNLLSALPTTQHQTFESH